MAFSTRVSGVIGLLWLSAFGALGQSALQAFDWRESPQERPDSTGALVRTLWFAEATGVDASGLPYYSLYVPQAVANFRFEAPIFAPLSPEEAELLRGVNLPSVLQPTIERLSNRRQPVSYVTFVPLRQNPQTGSLEKLVSFRYQTEAATDGSPLSGPTDTRDYADQSVLAQGTWYKLAVTESGLYRIDANFLRGLGLDPNAINPQQLAIYGNGMGMLPERNSEPRHDDLRENAIWLGGTAPDRFGNGGVLLFYAQGPHTWSYVGSEDRFRHHFNFYSDTTFYFLTVKPGAPGLRVGSRPSASGASTTYTTFDERRFHERDLVNLLKSGRNWYGETFGLTTEHTISLDFTDAVPGEQMRLNAALIAASRSESRFQVVLNRQPTPVGQVNINKIVGGLYTEVAQPGSETFVLPTDPYRSAASLEVTLRHVRTGDATGHLDHLSLTYPRQLRLTGDALSFRVAASRLVPTAGYALQTPSADLRVWDVTDPTRPVEQAHNNGNFAAATDGQIREFVAFRGNAFPAPRLVGTVPNQNLHGLNANVPEMLIITHPNFLAEAERLARHRQQHDGLTVAVVTTPQVYNEFGSGAPDLTALRDLVRMLYDRGGDRLRYLLLMGDASYDYKNRVANNTNLVPTYQSPNSLAPLRTYCTDDFIGFLADNEGVNLTASHVLDMAIGRLAARTSAEAAVMVDKLVRYDTEPAALGRWRNRICLVGDDGDSGSHMRDAEIMASTIENLTNKRFDFTKVYVDAFEQFRGAGGEVAPEATRTLNRAVEEGSLIINYSGHGSVQGWTSERVLVQDQIRTWENRNRLAVFVTATCDFGLFDDPLITSGGELLLLAENGAGVGLVTSTRLVFQSQNRAYNLGFYNALFGDNALRLGEANRGTKNRQQSSDNTNSLKYALLGDPAMRVAVPPAHVRISHVNQRPVVPTTDSASTDTLRALQRVQFKGELRQSRGVKFSDYNGTAEVVVFDKAAVRSTRGMGDNNDRNPVPFRLRNSAVYIGLARVVNGDFSFEFVVPRDIAFPFGTGKVSVYVQPQEGLNDAGGASFDFTIGGLDTNAVADNTPPEVELFLNDESFVFGGTVGPSPLVLARLRDDSGINVSTTGIGNGITSVLNENEDDLRLLNANYVADTGSFQSGTVRYDGYRDLEPGRYGLRFKAWDTHNNSADAYLEFMVAEDVRLALKNVLNYPNPFTTRTSFHFDHNRAGDDLDVQIQVFTISGKLVKTITLPPVLGSPTHIGSMGTEIVWDGRDDFGDAIGRGVYIYKVNVRASDGTRAHQYEKLVILN